MKNRIRQSGPEEDKGGNLLVRRLLRIFSIILLAILVILVAAIAGLYLYEPTPAEGFDKLETLKAGLCSTSTGLRARVLRGLCMTNSTSNWGSG
jgi:peptidoglycan/LPS O-acetylase OafA/YrhL